jgi:hypothetical protein
VFISALSHFSFTVVDSAGGPANGNGEVQKDREL